MVKNAYLEGLKDPRYQGMTAQITALIFLSTPHRGSDLAKTLDNILSLWLSPYSQKAFIKELTKGSPTLARLNEEFRHAAPKMELYSFYECIATTITSFKKVRQATSHSLTFPNIVGRK